MFHRAHVALLLALFLPASAHAQSVVPPAPQSVPAPDRNAGDHEVVVELEIAISAKGTVDSVRVISTPQPAFDEAATDALGKATFTPATKDGTPVAVKIRYAYTFPAAPPPPEPEPVVVAEPAPTPPPAPPPPAPEEEQATFGARAVTEAPPRETTVRSMESKELASLGVRGDPIRAVELLPGFARLNLGQTQPIIRGSAPNESQVLFEGMPVPLLYHFGGLTSFIPARALERIDYYPGNFSARYGRILGGVVDVRARDARNDGLHGVLDASFIDASIFAESPLGTPDVSAMVGFRRSYVDAYFSSIAPADLQVDAAPVYYDYQAFLTAKLGERHRLRMFLYGSSDSFKVNESKPADDDASIRGQFEARTNFHRLQGTLSSNLGKRVTQDITLSAGLEQYKTHAASIVDLDTRNTDLRARAEWTVRPTDTWRIVFGLDHASQRWTGTYEGLRPQLEGSLNRPVSQTPRTGASLSRWVHAPALYLESPFVAGPITFIPSVRSDHLATTESLTIDPRLAIRARVAEHTIVKGGVGKFTQHPEVWQTLGGDVGNPNLEPGWALHVSTGVEQTIGESFKASAEGFYKTLQHLPVSTQNFDAPYWVNEGKGRIYGLELEARVLPKERVYGLLAYTLSRSERANQGEKLRLFDNDQTHVGSLAVVARLGRGWELGATFRMSSANPKTPVVGAVYDGRTDTYAARYGALNSDRDAIYHRLDLHLEKSWTFTAWKLMAYVDIQNVYNSQNPETNRYNYDYTASTPGATFPPFFPSLGLRGEL